MSAEPPLPLVSVVIPCRNEDRFIEACLNSIIKSDFPKERLEVLVVDGMSDDLSREIARRIAEPHAHITLVDSPGRTAPAALNLGIRTAKGDIIVRLDVHAVYPADYISKLVGWLETSGADNVGGVCRTLPANRTAKAGAIAAGLAHPFGVGNAHFRIGVREPRWVDTVPFGCYRRVVFDRIGFFDEDLVRNQDDEFNARLIRSGGRILLVPDVVSEYFARESLAKLWRAYYQYGYFKPLAARKLGRVMTVRQTLPALLVSMAIAGMVLAWPLSIVRLPLLAILIGYLATDLVCAMHASRRHGIRSVFWLTVVFPVLHISYGLGYLKGVIDFVFQNKHANAHARAVAPSR